MEGPMSVPISLPKDRVDEVERNLNQRLLKTPAVGAGGPSFYKIPNFMKEVHPKAFNPYLVSFGPYHYGNECLARMELEKCRALKNFQTNCRLPLESIVRRVSSMLEDVLGMYDELQPKWKEENGRNFLELMVMDGCFMLELLDNNMDWLSNMRDDIRRDMLLLENQLPMKLLKELHSMTEHSNTQNVISLVCNFIGISENVEKKLKGEYLHVLEMYTDSLSLCETVHKAQSREADKELGPENQIIRHATQLRDSGIRFKWNESRSLTEVHFDKERGVFSLPQIVVDDDTESDFLNAMAFEKLHKKAGNKVTSFIILMDRLIDVDQDVALLASKDIIVNALGNDRDAAELFGRLGQGVAMDLESNPHIRDMQTNVNAHCRKPWNSWRASLKHDYFRHPWAIVSLFAAALGFAILILQVVYQICDYY